MNPINPYPLETLKGRMFFFQDDEHSELQVEVILEPQGVKDDLL